MAHGAGARGNRPGGAVTVNQNSWQARGLMYWMGIGPECVFCDLSNQRVTSYNGVGPNIVAFDLGGLGVNDAGSTDRVNLSNFTPPTIFTVVAWVRGLSSVVGGTYYAIVEGNRSANGHYGLWRSGAGPNWHFRWSPSAASDFGAAANNAVTMLVGTFDGANANAYQNGVVKLNSASSRAAAAAGSTTFLQSGAGEPYNSGCVADVRMYNYAWTPAQVWDAYSAAGRWDLYQVASPSFLWMNQITTQTVYRLPLLGAG